ncbi:phosphoenolpyruvate--protein phosphotransferase [Halomonas huangheensis]|uniref:phosphoenolpyruvate--protein phosphotransferase n=1 Tax=Halomonas huangheensis TaxID=1178482 RepID=W1N484_9GAMM|nr:phosphoenolpyruvate--protein phosphotransferase [Halomonas huangheensis]ALM51848.1 phosphoenolpyruvate-protein phosphotransferase [Halomonas huangheensis]ERL50372.1 hypothetical protein BJB45_04385 [Halomonas huangheensis]
MSSSNVILASPLKGIVVPLAEVPDPVFAEGALGSGIALDPLASSLHAPISGEVIQCARTHHAYTLRSAEGIEVLVHLGLDTVALEGRGIYPCVEQGQQVAVGDLLCEFDMDQLACSATSLVTPLILLDTGAWRVDDHTAEAGKLLEVGAPLLTLSPRMAESSVAGVENAASIRVEQELTVALEVGLHARPAARLRNIGRDYHVELLVRSDEHTANGNSVSGLMNLGLICGSRALVIAEGEQAQAALAAAVALLTTPEGHAAPSHVEEQAPQQPLDGNRLGGLMASPGLVSGRLVRLELGLPKVPLTGEGSEVEKPRLLTALRIVGQQLEDARIQAESTGQQAEAEVFEAHQAWLEDPDLVASAMTRLQEGLSPGQAWREALDAEVERLKATGNAILIGRIADLRDLQRRVMAEFSDIPDQGFGELAPDAIVATSDLTPSGFVSLCDQHPAGLCLAAGGSTSHVAILARARGIPCLVAMGDALLELDDEVVVLNADQGQLEMAPDAARLEQVTHLLEVRRRQADAERAESHLEVFTRDSCFVEVAANVGSSEEAQLAADSGADAVGLLRSEFLFLGRDSAPGEEEQRREYQASVDALGAKPVVIRTLDIGADKQLPYLQLPPSPNPALGVRGMRLWQVEPELLDSQLRALLGVRPLRYLRVMVPMISDASELEWVRKRMEALAAEMHLTELPLLGAMIEVPSAALCAASMANVADFLSIGTNDLTQYGLAMDREDPLLASQADVLHPGVLRLIQATLNGAAGRCPVAVCGAAAGDDLVGPLLVAMGVNELSVEPSRVAAVKARIRRLDTSVIAREIDTLLAMPDAASVRQALAPLVESALVAEVGLERIPS